MHIPAEFSLFDFVVRENYVLNSNKKTNRTRLIEVYLVNNLEPVVNALKQRIGQVHGIKIAFEIVPLENPLICLLLSYINQTDYDYQRKRKFLIHDLEGERRALTQQHGIDLFGIYAAFLLPFINVGRLMELTNAEIYASMTIPNGLLFRKTSTSSIIELYDPDGQKQLFCSMAEINLNAPNVMINAHNIMNMVANTGISIRCSILVTPSDFLPQQIYILLKTEDRSMLVKKLDLLMQNGLIEGVRVVPIKPNDIIRVMWRSPVANRPFRTRHQSRSSFWEEIISLYGSLNGNLEPNNWKPEPLVQVSQKVMIPTEIDQDIEYCAPPVPKPKIKVPRVEFSNEVSQSDEPPDNREQNSPKLEFSKKFPSNQVTQEFLKSLHDCDLSYHWLSSWILSIPSWNARVVFVDWVCAEELLDLFAKYDPSAPIFFIGGTTGAFKQFDYAFGVSRLENVNRIDESKRLMTHFSIVH